MAYSNGNCCANCQFWDGERKVSSLKDKAEFKAFGDMGLCLNSKSANTKGKMKRADNVCSRSTFVKWDQLR